MKSTGLLARMVPSPQRKQRLHKKEHKKHIQITVPNINTYVDTFSKYRLKFKKEGNHSKKPISKCIIILCQHKQFWLNVMPDTFFAYLSKMMKIAIKI